MIVNHRSTYLEVSNLLWWQRSHVLSMCLEKQWLNAEQLWLCCSQNKVRCSCQEGISKAPKTWGFCPFSWSAQKNHFLIQKTLQHFGRLSSIYVLALLFGWLLRSAVKCIHMLLALRPGMPISAHTNWYLHGFFHLFLLSVSLTPLPNLPIPAIPNL